MFFSWQLLHRREGWANVVRIFGYLVVAVEIWEFWKVKNAWVGNLIWYHVLDYVLILTTVCLYISWFASLANRKKGGTA